MKYYFFGHKIRGGSLNYNELVDFVNTCEENMTIGLSSEGGEVGSNLFLLEVLNDKKDRIHLVAAGVIFSAAFDLWVGFKGYKSVLAGTLGMTHMADMQIRISERGEYRTEDLEMLQNSISFSEITDQITFPVMTPKQIKKYEEGGDVYFTCDNLRKIATRQNKSNRAIKPE